MSDTDEASGHLLESVWPLIDVKGTGFIYGRDFPLAVSKMEELLNKGQGRSKTSLVSKTGQEILKKFSSDQEFFKVYKDDFAELFDGLLGTTFRTAVQSCSREGGPDFGAPAPETASFHDNEDTPVESTEMLRGEIATLRNQLGELRRQNDGKDQIIAAKEALLVGLRNTSGSPTASPLTKAGARSLQARISHLSEEIQARDDAIREKDHELLSMTKKVGEYRDKYQFLEREFQFYKDHGELQKPEATKEATRHEFIISELRRKITDQSDMINTMRSQVESRKTPIPRSKAVSVESTILDIIPPQKVVKWIGAVLGILLVTNIVLYLIATIRSMFGSYSASGLGTKIRLNWWERSSLSSKIVWFFSDYFEQDWSTGADENINSSYNKIFGV
ncbi:LAFA_0G20450g1_1 [Lachancea sp. 'fantastica']|nr:LAFA_0G20450g1_1 [Lachancea sp. 'fantastica']